MGDDAEIVRAWELLRSAGRKVRMLAKLLDGGYVESDAWCGECSDLADRLDEAVAVLEERLITIAVDELDDRTVLIVDDSELFAKSLQRRLHAAGIAAYYETDATKAGDAFALLKPKTVFVDVVMERSGVQVAADLAALSPRALIVLITGVLTDEIVFAAGVVADFVVEKDVGMEVMVSIAQGEVPNNRVVRNTAPFEDDDRARWRNAAAAVREHDSLAEAARALQMDWRTLKKLLQRHE